MMTKIKLLIFGALFVCFSSCDASSEDDSQAITPNEIEVEYQIMPIDNYITTLKYTDSHGNLVDIDDLSQFPNGLKIISITDVPFQAKLEATIDNVSNSVLNYELIIKVEGDVKSITSIFAPPGNTTIDLVEYTVE